MNAHGSVTCIKAPANTNSEAHHLFHAAYVETAGDRAALAPNEVYPVNLDVQAALTTVMGVVPKLHALRASIVESLPTIDIAEFDDIETFARALAYAQTVYLAASTPIESLPELVQRAAAVRDQLLSDATALARRGLIDARPLDELKKGPGYLNAASDLGVLVRIFRERWSVISSKSAVQLSELDEAEQLFERITTAYAQRSQPSPIATAAADDRQRAFTLLIKAYDQARRAARYLRWDQDDAEKFLPSVWAGRGNHPSSNAAAPVVVPQAPPASTTSPANAPTQRLVPVAPAVVTASNGGLPGGSPFSDT